MEYTFNGLSRWNPARLFVWLGSWLKRIVSMIWPGEQQNMQSGIGAPYLRSPQGDARHGYGRHLAHTWGVTDREVQVSVGVSSLQQNTHGPERPEVYRVLVRQASQVCFTDFRQSSFPAGDHVLPLSTEQGIAAHRNPSLVLNVPAASEVSEVRLVK